MAGHTSQPGIRPGIAAGRPWATAFGGSASALSDVGRTFELVRVSPGPRVFERFGHVLLCSPLSQSEERGTCVDFGAADYSRPATLLLQQLRSEAPYQIQRVPMGQALWKFRSANRTVVRQRLALNDIQARRLGERLVQVTAGEPRTYPYDILHRNCVTELRDTLFAEGINEVNSRSTTHSYRQLLEESLHEGWADAPMLFAMDLAAGRAFDVPVLAPRDRLFLPELLSDAFATQTSISTQSTQRTRSTERTRTNSLEAALLVCLAAAATISVWRKAPTAFRAISRSFAALLLGTLGLIVWSVAALIPNLGWSENMLALVPSDYLLLVQRPRFRFYYCAARLLSIFALAILQYWAYFQQPLSLVSFTACLPLVIFLSAAVSNVCLGRSVGTEVLRRGRLGGRAWLLRVLGVVACLSLCASGCKRTEANTKPSRASAKTPLATGQGADWTSPKPYTVPPAAEQFDAQVKQSILALAEVGAKKPHCQAIALDPLTVLFPKHCLTAAGIELILSSPQTAVVLEGIRVHPTLDVALATVVESLPISIFADIGDSCAPHRTAMSACVWGEAARKLGLHSQTLGLACAASGECLSESMTLAAGASGCPAFDMDAKVLLALGYGWSRRGSHFVCVTRDLIQTLRLSNSEPLGANQNANL